MYDLLLKNAWVVDPLNSVNGVADVAIQDGKIAKVQRDITEEAKEVIDFTGKTLQPGIIDSHVHLGEMWGSPFGPRMLAMNGVTTCLDMAGPLDNILDNVPKYGVGINMAILQFASPPFTFKDANPSQQEMIDLIDKSLEEGALGVKLLGGHYPLEPEVSSLLIRTALERRAYVAWHAGTTKNGSNINGMIEAVKMGDGYPLHLAHINAYCRGRVNPVLDEVKEALDLLKAHPNIWSEAYVSPMNGTILTCDTKTGACTDHVTCNCLRTFGCSEDAAGIEKAILAGNLFVIYDDGNISYLIGGKEAVDYWKSKGTVTAGSFPVNPASARFLIAEAKRDDGSFVVDSISTDGGCIPRNVIIDTGLSLVRFGALTLSEFVVKASVNAARHLRLVNKGHLTPGADADITVFDLERQKALYSWVAGKPVLSNGKLLGKSTHFITGERGVKALTDAGFTAEAVSFETPEPERFVP